MDPRAAKCQAPNSQQDRGGCVFRDICVVFATVIDLLVLCLQREDVELGRFGTVGTIHIRTDVETLQYLEVCFFHPDPYC